MGMAQVQDLLDVMVTIEPYAGQDKHGTLSYRPPQSVKARIQQGPMWVRDAMGQSLLGKFKVYLGQAVQVDPRDRITLPIPFGVRDTTGAMQPLQPNILSVALVFYRGQHDHTVLVLS